MPGSVTICEFAGSSAGAFVVGPSGSAAGGGLVPGFARASASASCAPRGGGVGVGAGAAATGGDVRIDGCCFGIAGPCNVDVGGGWVPPGRCAHDGNDEAVGGGGVGCGALRTSSGTTSAFFVSSGM